MNAALLLAALAPPLAVAEAPTTRRDPVGVALCVPATVAAGGTFAVVVTLNAGGGYELHGRAARPPARPTRLTLTLPPGFESAGPWRDPPTVPSVRPGGGAALPATATFVRPVRVAGDPPAGRYEVTCEAAYQACDDVRCLRPTSRTLTVEVELADR